MIGIRLARRALVIVVAASVLALPTAISASAGVTALPRQAGLATLMKSYGSRYKDLIGNSFWQAAIAQSAVEAYDQATRGKSYLKDIAATYRTYVHGPNPLSGLPDFEDGYADDTAWWGLAWLQAYVITKNKNYLRVAEADANFIHRHRDKNQNSCGGSGGVWWVITGSSGYGRLAIPNALFLELTAWLHNVVHHDTKYLRWAKAEWAWFNRSGLIDRHNHLVWNGFGNAPKCTIGGTYWSYDMGAVIAGLAQLYRATKKAALLAEAKEIANATIRYLAPHGVLADQCQPRDCSFDQQSFKGIFIGDLRMLATIARTKAYNSFLKAQRFSVEAHDTSAGERFGLSWAGPIREPCPASTTMPSRGAAANVCTSYTQASAEAALVAALIRRLARHSASNVRPGERGWQEARTGRASPASPPRPSRPRLPRARRACGAAYSRAGDGRLGSPCATIRRCPISLARTSGGTSMCSSPAGLDFRLDSHVARVPEPGGDLPAGG